MTLPNMYSKLKRFLRGDSGATAVEYAVMMLIIILTVLSAIQVLGPALTDIFTTASNALDVSQ